MDTDFAIWWICFMPILIVLWMEYENRRRMKQMGILRQKRKNQKKGLGAMGEAFKRFIGKECIISTMSSSITGTVEAIEDNWLIIRSLKSGRGNDSDMVNIDYISRIQEYPKNNKGKKKIVIA